ncbi:uncharacterized protein LOC127788358 [Diospyros lotus]|uniref:uncharacterized protein LOC127788358 n=1 Tax=Diospyros lotus TaxID=55363 RepID=UPI00225C2960|nr:uncharacterized protein LOC127788358 [Diospyros lotus]XP_052172489.1 uncharacterized protein LOC127788358 [Diospyros lotus]
MDEDWERCLVELHQFATNHSGLPVTCTSCQRVISPDNEAGDLEGISLCGDCKFLFLEESGTPMNDTHQRRTRTRTRYSSSESIENLFSQHFSHIASLAMQGQPTALGRESQAADGDAAVRFQQHAHSRTTPTGSRRWSILSDTESDGFDSVYGDSESNISFGFNGYRYFRESDGISFSAYGGDSEGSVDGRSILETDMFVHPDAGSDLGGDTDIDPMHAGLDQWNSDDQEDDYDEDEEDNDWEEADTEENAAESSVGVQFQTSLGPSESNSPIIWLGQLRSPESPGAISLRAGERRETNIHNIFAEPEMLQLQVYRSPENDRARHFQSLLDSLAEHDNARRGAPPASVSFLNDLPRVVIKEDHENTDCLVCVICKDSLSVGTVANQLPCLHLYHPACILPWLQARNTCPLCRYELPTDNQDVEERRRNTSSRRLEHEIQQQEMSDYSSSEEEEEEDDDDIGDREFYLFAREEAAAELATEEHHATWSSSRESGSGSGRGRWLFLAAAPIVGLFGIALMLWLGNSGCHRFRLPDPSSGGRPLNQRENRSRRWWCPF